MVSDPDQLGSTNGNSANASERELFPMPVKSTITPPNIYEFTNEIFIRRFLKHTFTNKERPRMRNELRAPFELLELQMSREYRTGIGIPRAEGKIRTVITVAGAGADDKSLIPLNNFLRLAGYDVRPSGIWNIHPAKDLLPQLERLAKEITDETGQPVIQVGQSLGGSLIKLGSDAFPGHVFRNYGLAPVFNSSVGISPTTFAYLAPFATFELARKGLRRGAQLLDEELDQFRQLNEPVKVPHTSIFTQSDGVLSFKSCIRPDSDNYEVHSSHVGTAIKLEALMTLATLLHHDTKDAVAGFPKGPKSEAPRRERIRVAA